MMSSILTLICSFVSRLFFLWLCASFPLAVEAESVPADGIKPFVNWLVEDGDRFENVPFSEVVEAVSGCQVLAVDRSAEADGELLSQLEAVLAQMLDMLNAETHPVHEVGRVNEVSRHLENHLLTELNKIEGLSCAIPINAAGDIQRSGYPDLRLLHEASGRIFYLDPKVYRSGSESSSFRTFYFEPKKETNKILDHASHLIIGIEHGGKVDGYWHFASWKLVDLVDFRVRLKAEFQASNRDLYQPGAILSQGSGVPSE